MSNPQRVRAAVAPINLPNAPRKIVPIRIVGLFDAQSVLLEPIGGMEKINLRERGPLTISGR